MWRPHVSHEVVSLLKCCHNQNTWRNVSVTSDHFVVNAKYGGFSTLQTEMFGLMGRGHGGCWRLSFHLVIVILIC